jgi:secreted PhoX family phosphatase
MSRPKHAPTLQDILLTRRTLLKGMGAGMVMVAMPASLKASPVTLQAGLTFREIPKAQDITHHVAAHHHVQPVLKWGQGLWEDVPFDPTRFTAQQQMRAFGYNNDFIAYLPFPFGSSNSQHGLLFINHEYSNAELLFSTHDGRTPQERIAIEMAAQGCSVVEVQRIGAGWQVIHGSRFTRRITATTPMRFAGAAAGHKLLQTRDDPYGVSPIGTFANCSGGVTPWGTVLTAEENVDTYFVGTPTEKHARYGFGKKSYYTWHTQHPRFDMTQEPNEPNRFGWIVEIDPYRPDSTPVKRTSLGRFKHECATVTLAKDGRVVVYSGDDEINEYIYRYVSRDAYLPQEAFANRALLDEGELSVARFEADGTMEWIPLRYGERGLDASNGFFSQAELLIHARLAGDVVGATPMDRPEDIAVHPQSGAVYVSLTMNKERDEPNVANMRAHNAHGHILMLMPPEEDHTATRFAWQPFLLAGDPQGEDGAWYGNAPSAEGWLSNPDNLAFDNAGNLWIATDGQEKTIGKNEGLYAAATAGAEAGVPRCFFTAPRGAEVTGPCFTPDNTTLFVSVQHPAEGSTYDNPSTRWPDFKPHLPPRPSVVAITHKDGKVVGNG